MTCSTCLNVKGKEDTPRYLPPQDKMTTWTAPSRALMPSSRFRNQPMIGSSTSAPKFNKDFQKNFDLPSWLFQETMHSMKEAFLSLITRSSELFWTLSTLSRGLRWASPVSS